MTHEPRTGRFRGLLCLLLAPVSGVPLKAHFQRLIFCALVALSAWLPASSYAGCAAFGAMPAATSVAAWRVSGAPYYSSGGAWYNQKIEQYWTSGASVGVATGNISYLSAACTADPVCVPPKVLSADHNSCVTPPAPDLCAGKVGTSAGEYKAPSGTGGLGGATFTNLCDPISGSSTPGCRLTVVYDFAADGFKTGSGTFTGQGCTPDPTSDGSAAGGAAPASGAGTAPVPGAPAPTPCKSGTFSGSVNGVSVCVPPSGTGPTESKTTKDSGSTNDGVPTPSVKEEKSTKCVGSTCTTTTTTTTTQPTVGGVPGAVTVTVGTTTEGKAGVCTTDPKNPVCAGEGASDCPEDSTSLGCMKLGTPSDGVLSKVTKNIGVAGVDSLGGFNIGHACPADLTFDVMGRTQHMSFAGACDVAPLVKPLVVLAAAIAALFIVYAALTQKT